VLPGEVVFEIGDMTECFYMVKSGELQIEAEVTIEE
jgi:CRP-like cAMP-binding protein